MCTIGINLISHSIRVKIPIRLYKIAFSNQACVKKARFNSNRGQVPSAPTDNGFLDVLIGRRGQLMVFLQFVVIFHLLYVIVNYVNNAVKYISIGLKMARGSEL